MSKVLNVRETAQYIGRSVNSTLRMLHEGIIPAIETSHALAALAKIDFKKEDIVIVNLSGRGDKDLDTYIKYFDL